MEQVATKLRFAGEARVEHRDWQEGHSKRRVQGGQRPRSGENRAWMGQHIGLMGEQGEPSRAVGGKM